MKNKQERGSTYGLVSAYDQQPLFDRNDNTPVTFSKEVFDRRQDEVLHYAKKAGFKMVKSLSKNITFVKEVQYGNEQKSENGKIQG